MNYYYKEDFVFVPILNSTGLSHNSGMVNLNKLESNSRFGLPVQCTGILIYF